MKKLLAYLNGLTPAQQADYAARCKTTVGYLRKAISLGQRINAETCIRLERESGRAVLCEEMRSDVEWGYLRSTSLGPDDDARTVHHIGPASAEQHGEVAHG